MKKLVTILLLSTASLLFSAPVFAQNARITDFSGVQNLLDQSSDTVYVVNFWATWCGPCVKELPYFQELEEKFKDRKVHLTLVSLDFPDKMESRVLPFLRKRNIQSEVLLLDAPDANEWIDRLEKSWQGNIPVTLIFRNDKKLRKFIDGETNFEELNRIVSEFLD